LLIGWWCKAPGRKNQASRLEVDRRTPWTLIFSPEGRLQMRELTWIGEATRTP
jgi:hypothetical protein